MNPLYRIGTRVKVKTWPEIAEYIGVEYDERTFLELEGVVYDDANDDPIGLLDEMYEGAGRGEDVCLIVGGDTRTSSRPTTCVTYVQARWWNANRVRRTSSVIGC